MGVFGKHCAMPLPISKKISYVAKSLLNKPYSFDDFYSLPPPPFKFLAAPLVEHELCFMRDDLVVALRPTRKS